MPVKAFDGFDTSFLWDGGHFPAFQMGHGLGQRALRKLDAQQILAATAFHAPHRGRAGELNAFGAELKRAARADRLRGFDAQAIRGKIDAAARAKARRPMLLPGKSDRTQIRNAAVTPVIFGWCHKAS